MSILSTIFRGEKYLKGTDGYQKMSEWQLAKDVEYENGKNGEEVISDIKEQLTAGDTPFRFGVNEKGKYGYIITDSEGADTVIPFKSGRKIYTKIYNSDEATWRVPKNSSGNKSTTVGVLGRTTWTNISNSSYKYEKGFVLPLTEFEDLDYIFENPEKINYISVTLFTTPDSKGEIPFDACSFRLSRTDSVYKYYDSFNPFTNVVDWNKNKDENGESICIYGICDYSSKPSTDTSYGITVKIYNGSDGTQPRIDFNDKNFGLVIDYQFKGYMNYVLTIVYED